MATPRLNLALAFRLMARDARSGELTLLAAALTIAVAAAAAVGLFTDRLNRAMTEQSAELLGADLVLSSSQPVPPEIDRMAERSGLRAARTVEFASVALHGERLQLSAVSAVGPGFPPRGTLRIASVAYGADAPTRATPEPGAAWVEARLLTDLGVRIGDRIEIGASRFRITQLLTQEPGRAGNFFAFAPRVLIPLSDLDATGVVQPGSRVTYRHFYAGAPGAVSQFGDWLHGRLDPHQTLFDAHSGNASIGRALERVDRYLGLASLIAMVLAGVAIAMAARRYSERHFDASAMMRCLGSTQREVLALYLPQLVLLAALGGVLGGLIGWAVQQGLLVLLAPWLPRRLPAPGLWPWLAGFLTGAVMLLGFALPPILRLRRVPPLRVLRRELAPLPPSAWWVYGSAGVAIFLLMWRITGSIALTGAVAAGGAAAAAALALLALAALRLGQGLQPRAGVAWRFGLHNLWRRRFATLGQVLAFGLAFMAISVIALVRTDLLATWQAQIPPDAPNHFAFNILPGEVAGVDAFFQEHRIRASRIYPMVRGRLIAINDVPVQRAVTKEARDNEAIQRELNLTWSRSLPEDNTLLEGSWWGDGEDGHRASVEARLAERLGIRLGDQLTFSIGGEDLRAQVQSVRRVQWDSFHPNFYVVFPAGALDAFPSTYLTSFFLAPADKPLLAQLVQRFPSVTVLETDRVLAQVRSLLQQATLAVELVLLFTLAAGLAVLYAAINATLDERLYEGALLRAFGASRRQLRASQLAEFALIGLLAGLLAAFGTELVAWLLYTRVFDLGYVFKWRVWLIVPLAGAVFVGAAGLLGARRVVRTSPLVVLRDL